MKKIILIILTFVTIFALMATTVLANGDTMFSNSANISNIDISEDGTLKTVCVKVTDVDYKNSSLRLIVNSVNTQTDKIIQTSTDVVDVNKNTKEVELEASVNVDEGCTLEYYIVDATGASLRNSAPSEITGFKPFSTTLGVRVEWDEIQDDFGAECIVYKDGQEIGTTTKNYFWDCDVIADNTYKYTVKAVDTLGIETSMTEEKTAGLYMPSYINCGDTQDARGCKLIGNYTNVNSDSYIVKDIIAGVPCVKTVDRKDINGSGRTYIYVASNKDDVDRTVKEVTIVVEYYDNGIGSLTMEYINDSDAKKTDSQSVPMIGGGWKYAVFNVTDADFNAPTWLSNADVRFSNSASDLAVATVTIMPTENYAEPELAYSLEASSSLGEIELCWEVIDGFYDETLTIYRNGEEIATVDADERVYIDCYEQEDSDEPINYYISNENKTRISNTATITPFTIKNVLNQSAYINYNQLSDGAIAKRGIKNTPNNLLYYDGMDDASKLTADNKYIRGYTGANDNNVINVKNDELYSTTAITSDVAFAEETATQNFTNDGSNYVLKNKTYATVKKVDGVLSTVTNISKSSTWFEYVFDKNSFADITNNTDGDNTKSDYVAFVEYWNTGEQNFAVRYSMNDGDLDTNGNLSSGKISSEIYTTLPDATEGGSWSIAQFTLENMSYTGKSYDSGSGTSKMALIFANKTQTLAIRAIVLVPKELADMIEDSSMLFLSND